MELVPGCGVYQFRMDKVEKVGNIGHMAKDLLTCFYGGDKVVEKKELVNLDKNIVDAVIGESTNISIDKLPEIH